MSFVDLVIRLAVENSLISFWEKDSTLAKSLDLKSLEKDEAITLDK